MKTDLEVEVEVDLRPLVIIFCDKQTHRTFLLYIDLLRRPQIVKNRASVSILMASTCHKAHLKHYIPGFRVTPKVVMVSKFWPPGPPKVRRGRYVSPQIGCF